eukprot:TRINITY_DN46729_c0_g1_i1.p1 TRINITY_DN46729_c0_g1~~TRINITY_DN46729_c0_g1_i1.p1  ORF type:complete len:412 (-),score=84.25 TRINITY_DN46729_c0_g1_i1:4-1239(-)
MTTAAPDSEIISATRVCPMFRSQYGDSECGSSQGFGSCDSGSGRCMCAMGFAGRNCSQVVCCHVGLIIGFCCGVMLLAVLCVFYYLRCRSRVGRNSELKKTVVRPISPQDIEAAASLTMAGGAAEGSLRYSAQAAATAAARRPSSVGTSGAAVSTCQPLGSPPRGSTHKVADSTGPSEPAGLRHMRDPPPGLSEERSDAASPGLGVWARATSPSPTATKSGVVASPSSKAGAPRLGSKQRTGLGEQRSSPATTPQKSSKPPNGGTEERRSSEAPPGAVDQRRRSSDVPLKERRPSFRSSQASAKAAEERRTSSEAPPKLVEERRQSVRSSEVPPKAVPERRPSVRSSGGLPTTAASLKRYLEGFIAEPLLVRKQMFKELLLEYHPDKNDSPDAKDLFHVVNTARPWFLKEN